MKLYKYNVTDFMTLIQYPYIETLEAPKKYLNLAEDKITGSHDLSASIITKTARERAKKNALIRGKETKDDASVSTAGKGSSREDLSRKEAQAENVNTNTEEKAEDKSMNCRSQGSRSSEESSSTSLVNRNNNTIGQNKSSSEGSDESSGSYQDTRIKAKLNTKKAKRTVRFNSTAYMRNEEIEDKTKKASASASDEYKIAEHRKNTCSLPQLVEKKTDPRLLPHVRGHGKGSRAAPSAKGNHSTAGVSHQRMKSPTILPPINNKRQPLATRRQNADILKELAEEQAQILADKIRVANTNAGTEKEWLDTNSALIQDYFNNFQEDINFNRNFKDINANSCFRARSASSSIAKQEKVNLSVFNEYYLNLPQFVQLIETIVGHHPDNALFATLVHYLTEGYQDTESEKTDRLLQARNEAIEGRKKATLDNLFEKWDNEASGFLDLEEVVDILNKFKDGQEIEVIKIAQSNLRKQSQHHDQRLSKKEFRQFINLVVDEIPGHEIFDILVEFLVNSVERSYAERIRGEARKKWLQQINIAAQISGTSLEPVYKAVFQALYKDAETHGEEKRISASISMLEVNKLEPQKGPLLLRYSACTPEDCQYMLGKPLYKNMKGVSFQAVETGKPIHVPRVASHGSVYFWNYDRKPENRGGSFVAVPLKDNKKRVFGVLGVDTLIDPSKRTIFITHEIHFFQGVAKAFSIAYHMVERRRKFLRIMGSAISWMHCRCPHIVDIIVYVVEPNTKLAGDYLLRKIMIKDKQGIAVQVSEVNRLDRRDSLFRNYLFVCMETSETVAAELNGERHIACPIRSNEGATIGIIDLNLGELKNLPRYESREAQRMLRLLQLSYREITNISLGEEPDCVLEVECDLVAKTDILFERIMLQELRDNLARLDEGAYFEINTFYEPPRIIAEIFRATLAVLKVDQVGEGEYDDWDELKNCFTTNELTQNIISFDPTVAANLHISDKVVKYLKATFNATFDEIARQGNIMAQQFYNWVSVCISLMEYTRKVKENAEGNVLKTAGDEVK